MKEKPAGRLVKTTIAIPEDLLYRAKRHALDERTDLRVLVIEGLELRLQQKPREIRR
jgi:hypothetical protein